MTQYGGQREAPDLYNMTEFCQLYSDIVNCRSAALSWLPGSLLFVGNIYAGSRALACLVSH